MNQGLYRVYQKAGSGYLATRMQRIFVQIKTEEDRILHNEAMADLEKLLNGGMKDFYSDMWSILYGQLRPKKPTVTKRVKRFLSVLAGSVLRIAQKRNN